MTGYTILMNCHSAQDVTVWPEGGKKKSYRELAIRLLRIEWKDLFRLSLFLSYLTSGEFTMSKWKLDFLRKVWTIDGATGSIASLIALQRLLRCSR